VTQPSAFEVEMSIEKRKGCRSQCIDQIPAELIEGGSKTICSEIHKVIHALWNKEDMPEEWKDSSLYLSIRRVIKQTVLITETFGFCQLHTKFYPTSCCQG
jgi:hypothetical protein